MQPQKNPCRVLLGLHGNGNVRFYLKNLFCLECQCISLEADPSVPGSVDNQNTQEQLPPEADDLMDEDVLANDKTLK